MANLYLNFYKWFKSICSSFLVLQICQGHITYVVQIGLFYFPLFLLYSEKFLNIVLWPYRDNHNTTFGKLVGQTFR